MERTWAGFVEDALGHGMSQQAAECFDRQHGRPSEVFVRFGAVQGDEAVDFETVDCVSRS
jgi:hypothetical protein